MEKIIISCLESRVETNRSIYARFLLGPFKDDNAITIATALRRALLSKVKSIAITAIHIQGVTHEFSTIVGVRESVLDLALNFQQVVLRTKTDAQRKRNFEGISFNLKGNRKRKSNQTLFSPNNWTTPEMEIVQIGYLQMQGPAVVYANDLRLPAGIECVDPGQYIATLSTEGLLVVKFLIGKKKACFDTNVGALVGERFSLNPGAKASARRAKAKLVQPLLQSVARKNREEKNKINKLRKGSSSFVQTGFLEKKVADLVKSHTKTKGFERASYVVNAKASLLQKKFQFLQAMQTKTGLLGLKQTVHSQSHPLANPFTGFDPTICLRNTIFLDPIFNSVIQANYVIEKDNLFNQARERVVLEFWTNGSVHPRQAVHKASLSLISTFSIFRKMFHLDSL